MSDQKKVRSTDEPVFSASQLKTIIGEHEYAKIKALYEKSSNKPQTTASIYPCIVNNKEIITISDYRVALRVLSTCHDAIGGTEDMISAIRDWYFKADAGKYSDAAIRELMQLAEKYEKLDNPEKKKIAASIYELIVRDCDSQADTISYETALMQLGKLCQDGIPQNLERACQLYKTVINLSGPKTMEAFSQLLNVGQKYQDMGGETNQKEAVSIYQAAEEAKNCRDKRGYHQVLFHLGVCYERGIGGLEKSLSLAKELYKKSAEQSYEPAIEALKRLQSEAAFTSALRKDQELADKKNGNKRSQQEAQYRLGTYYEYGTGVPQDTEAAMDWYRKAADQETPHGEAAYRLGCLYEKASKIAKKENSNSMLDQYELALCYYQKANKYGNSHTLAKKTAEKLYPTLAQLKKEYKTETTISASSSSRSRASTTRDKESKAAVPISKDHVKAALAAAFDYKDISISQKGNAGKIELLIWVHQYCEFDKSRHLTEKGERIFMAYMLKNIIQKTSFREGWSMLGHTCTMENMKKVIQDFPELKTFITKLEAVLKFYRTAQLGQFVEADPHLGEKILAAYDQMMSSKKTAEIRKELEENWDYLEPDLPPPSSSSLPTSTLTPALPATAPPAASSSPMPMPTKTEIEIEMQDLTNSTSESDISKPSPPPSSPPAAGSTSRRPSSPSPSFFPSSPAKTLVDLVVGEIDGEKEENKTAPISSSGLRPRSLSES